MLSDKLLPRFYLAPGIKRLRIPPFCRRLRFRDRATPSLPQPTEYYDFQFRKARTSVSVGVSRPKIIIILRLLDEQKVQILSPPPSLSRQKKLHSSVSALKFRVCTTSNHPPPSQKKTRREETEWANKSKQNYLKTHTHCLPSSGLGKSSSFEELSSF